MKYLFAAIKFDVEKFPIVHNSATIVSMIFFPSDESAKETDS